MKKNYKLIKVFTVGLVVLLTASCVNDEYNLDDLSKEITIGADGLTVPLGNIEPVVLDSLLKDAKDEIKPNADGVYAYEYKSTEEEEEHSFSIGQIEAIENFMPVFPEKIITLENNSGGLPINGGSLSLNAYAIELTVPFSLEKPIDKSIDIPTEIKSLTSVVIKDADNGEPVVMICNFAITNSPIKMINITDFKMQLPAYMDVDKEKLEQEGFDLSDQNVLSKAQITIDTELEKTEIVKLTIKGFKDINIVENKLSLDADLKISGNVSVTLTSDSQIGTEIALTPILTVSKVKVDQITGKIDVDFSEYIKPIPPIDLSSIVDVIGDSDVELNLASPTIKLDIENPIGVPIDCVMIIIPKDSSGVQLGEGINTGIIRINPATLTASGVKKVVITEDPGFELTGYETIVVENLGDIINLLPSSLTMSMDLNVADSETHTLVLKDSYDFKAAFNVGMALEFDKDGGLTYGGVLDKIDLKDVFMPGISAGKVSVILDTETTLPLNLDVALVFQDASGEAIPGVNTESKTIEGTPDGEVKKSQTTITVTFPGGGDLSLLGTATQVKYTLVGKAPEAAGLKPEQYLKAKVSLHAETGVTIDLDEIGKNDDNDNNE